MAKLSLLQFGIFNKQIMPSEIFSILRPTIFSEYIIFIYNGNYLRGSPEYASQTTVFSYVQYLKKLWMKKIIEYYKNYLIDENPNN